MYSLVISSRVTSSLKNTIVTSILQWMVQTKETWLNISNGSYLIRCHRVYIEQVSNTRFLGFHIQKSLGWETHIEELCHRVSKVCYALFRLRQVSGREALLAYYNDMVFSRVKHGVQFWKNSHVGVRVFEMQKRTFFISHKSTVYVGVKLSNKLPQNIRNRRSLIRFTKSMCSKHTRRYNQHSYKKKW